MFLVVRPCVRTCAQAEVFSDRFAVNFWFLFPQFYLDIVF